MSVDKSASTFIPKTNRNEELETICKNLSETKININKLQITYPLKRWIKFTYKKN